MAVVLLEPFKLTLCSAIYSSDSVDQLKGSLGGLTDGDRDAGPEGVRIFV